VEWGGEGGSLHPFPLKHKKERKDTPPKKKPRKIHFSWPGEHFQMKKETSVVAGKGGGNLSTVFPDRGEGGKGEESFSLFRRKRGKRERGGRAGGPRFLRPRVKKRGRKERGKNPLLITLEKEESGAPVFISVVV